jgi:hypothetical protein
LFCFRDPPIHPLDFSASDVTSLTTLSLNAVADSRPFSLLEACLSKQKKHDITSPFRISAWHAAEALLG